MVTIKNSYNDLPVNKCYFGYVYTDFYAYLYIGLKLNAEYSTFLIIGYEKYFHILRLFNNEWTDETIL